MKNLTLVLLGLVVLAFTIACSEQAPSATTAPAPAPAQQSTPSSGPANTGFATATSKTDLKQIEQSTDLTPQVPHDDSESSEQVRVFPVEDILPAEQNTKPATTSEDTVPAYRAPEDSEEITPVNLHSTGTY